MRRSVLGAAALLLLVAGCGGDPKADPPPSPSASVSTSPSPTAPAMPAAATENSEAGAIAFVRYYVQLVNHAQSTGDVDQLTKVEDPACKSCRTARQGVVAHYQAGGNVRGGDWRIDSVSALRNEAIAGWLVDLSISYGDQTVSFGPSKPAKVNRAGRTILSVQVTRETDQWRVREWTRAS